MILFMLKIKLQVITGRFYSFIYLLFKKRTYLEPLFMGINDTGHAKIYFKPLSLNKCFFIKRAKPLFRQFLFIRQNIQTFRYIKIAHYNCKKIKSCRKIPRVGNGQRDIEKKTFSYATESILRFFCVCFLGQEMMKESTLISNYSMRVSFFNTLGFILKGRWSYIRVSRLLSLACQFRTWRQDPDLWVDHWTVLDWEYWSGNVRWTSLEEEWPHRHASCRLSSLLNLENPFCSWTAVLLYDVVETHFQK